MTHPTLPSNLALLPRIADAQQPDMQELFHYVLSMLLIEADKAQIVERRKIDWREELTKLTVAGEVPVGGIVKPEVGNARLAQLREMAREGLDEDRTAGA